MRRKELQSWCMLHTTFRQTEDNNNRVDEKKQKKNVLNIHWLTQIDQAVIVIIIIMREQKI